MWYTITDSNVKIYVFAKPNAKKSSLIKITDDAIHIAIHAKPQEGAANKALIEFLAAYLKLPKSQVQIARGERSRYKCVMIPMSKEVQRFLENPLQ